MQNKYHIFGIYLHLLVKLSITVTETSISLTFELCLQGTHFVTAALHRLSSTTEFSSIHTSNRGLVYKMLHCTGMSYVVVLYCILLSWYESYQILWYSHTADKRCSLLVSIFRLSNNDYERDQIVFMLCACKGRR